MSLQLVLLIAILKLLSPRRIFKLLLLLLLLLTGFEGKRQTTNRDKRTQRLVSRNVEGRGNAKRQIVVMPRRGEMTGHWRRQHPMELRIALRQSSNICQPVPIVVSCTSKEVQ